MSESQNWDDLLVEVAELADLDDVIRLEEGRTAWLLGLNDDETVLVEWQEATRRMMFMLEIGPLPEPGRERCLLDVLYYNLLWQQTGGARIALLPPGNHLQLMLDVHAEQLGATQITNVIGSLWQVAQAWRESLAQTARTAPETSEDTATSSQMEDPTRFLRV